MRFIRLPISYYQSFSIVINFIVVKFITADSNTQKKIKKKKITILLYKTRTYFGIICISKINNESSLAVYTDTIVTYIWISVDINIYRNNITMIQ